MEDNTSVDKMTDHPSIKGGFMQVPYSDYDELIQLKPKAVILYLYMRRMSNKDYKPVFASQEYFANKLHMAVRSIRTYENDLKNAGFIEITKKGLGRLIHFLPAKKCIDTGKLLYKHRQKSVTQPAKKCIKQPHKEGVETPLHIVTQPVEKHNELESSSRDINKSLKQEDKQGEKPMSKDEENERINEVERFMRNIAKPGAAFNKRLDIKRGLSNGR